MTTDYLATLNGQWDYGSVPALGHADVHAAQQEGSASLRGLLGATGDTLDFYLVSRDTGSELAHVTRWVVFSYLSGPTLRVGATAAHPADVRLQLRVYPLAQVRHYARDDNPAYMPYKGILSDVVPALLLQHMWRTGPKQLTIGDYGTGIFTPDTLTFGDLTVPYDTTGLATYRFTLAEATPNPPGVWLVRDEASWKVSYAVDDATKTYTERWDAPDTPPPTFGPLPSPVPVMPPPG